MSICKPASRLGKIPRPYTTAGATPAWGQGCWNLRQSTKCYLLHCPRVRGAHRLSLTVCKAVCLNTPEWQVWLCRTHQQPSVLHTHQAYCTELQQRYNTIMRCFTLLAVIPTTGPSNTCSYFAQPATTQAGCRPRGPRCKPAHGERRKRCHTRNTCCKPLKLWNVVRCSQCVLRTACSNITPQQRKPRPSPTQQQQQCRQQPDQRHTPSPPRQPTCSQNCQPSRQLAAAHCRPPHQPPPPPQ